MSIDLSLLNKIIKNKNIVATGLRIHSKASEHYVDVTITQNDGYTWVGSIPYMYRRTGLFIEKPQELAEYLESIYPLFTEEAIKKFVETERQRWATEMNGKGTTKAFFDQLLNLNWNSVQKDLPTNPNFARRIQDIKEFGYTLATDTRRKITGTHITDTHILLVPITKGGETGYEVMSPAFKARAIAVLNAVNVYELSTANKHGLIPDHKFPEIRWDDNTKAHNALEMGDADIKAKFQLIDNQRNQQKREVCRKCFQTDQRGKLYGLNYYYSGNENWSKDIPKVGLEAEKGCVGCGWYDIKEWRDNLNGLIKKSTE